MIVRAYHLIEDKGALVTAGAIQPPMLATAGAIALPDGDPPEWIKLFPLGEIPARDGRRWRLRDAAAAQAVVARTKDWYGAADPFVDYDHQIVSTLKQEAGAAAPAAGWIKDFQVRDDGLYARIDWTARAAAAIKAREYRYVSPYFTHDTDGNVTSIVNVALVNRPALDLPALAAAISNQDGVSSMDKQLLAALGLAETATLEDALMEIGSLSASAAALKPTLAAVGLAEDAKPDDLAAAVADLVKVAAKTAADIPDPKAFVPRALFDELAAKVTTMESTAAATAAVEAVDEAIAAGKLTPAQKDWALKYAGADLAGFKAFAAAAPVLTAVSGAKALPPGSAAATAGLSVEEADVARMLGIKPEDFGKNKETN